MKGAQLAQIHPRAFAHPYDLKATEALRKVPFLDTVLRKVAELNIEERFRADQMFSSIRLGPNQLPSLWRMVHEVAERLGMPQPTAYVSRQTGANAFAFGRQNHSIVLTTELVDLMLDKELEAIIAHELAHILCQHMLYRDVGLALATGTVALTPISKLTPSAIHDSLSAVFQAWSRSAEYTADRAALLVLEDPEAFVSCLSKLAGVPKRYLSEFDPRQFAEQVDEYHETATTWSKLVTWNLSLMRSHPEPAKRAAALLDWAESEEYRAILAGNFPTILDGERDEQVVIPGVRSCPLCNRPVADLPVCGHCGLEQDPSRQGTCPRGHLVTLGWKFCKSCGCELSPQT